MEKLMRSDISQGNTCYLCYGDLGEQPVTLACSHRFGRDCFTEFAHHILSQKNIDFNELKCPSCSAQMSIDKLYIVLEKEQIQRLNQESIKQNYIIGLAEDETLVSCLNNQCTNKFVIWKGADYFTCNSCLKKYCRQCSELFHENLTCLQNQQKIRLTQSGLKFMAEMKNYDAKLCPHCFRGVQKSGGCNFITCQSPECKGKKYFCFQCQIPLAKEDQFAHFEGRCPFKGQCLVKIDGKWIPPPKIVLQNPLPCPGCGNLENKITVFETNLKNNVCICKSKKCQGAVYCLICKQVLKDKILEDHIIREFDCNVVIKQQ